MRISRHNCWKCGSIYSCYCSADESFQAGKQIDDKIMHHWHLRVKRAMIEDQLREIECQIKGVGRQIQESADNKKVMFT